MSTPSRRQAVTLARAKAAAQARREAQERLVATLFQRGLQQIEALLTAEASKP